MFRRLLTLIVSKTCGRRGTKDTFIYFYAERSIWNALRCMVRRKFVLVPSLLSCDALFKEESIQVKQNLARNACSRERCSRSLLSQSALKWSIRIIKAPTLTLTKKTLEPEDHLFELARALAMDE